MRVKKAWVCVNINFSNRKQFIDMNDVRNHSELLSHRKRVQKTEDTEADVVDNNEINLVETETNSVVPMDEYLQGSNLQYFKMEA